MLIVTGLVYAVVRIFGVVGGGDNCIGSYILCVLEASMPFNSMMMLT